MDASQRARRRRGGGSRRLPDLALIASLFLHPSQISPARAAAVGLSGTASASTSAPALDHSSPQLFRRIQGEHVVLADCRDKANVFSSQMAYFLGEPGPVPQDVAVVVTSPGQAALWVNTNTSGLFTGTGTTFTATLGARVEDGQFAGTGNNGYGNFSCYQRYAKDLYVYETTTCSQVYLCDHSDPPGPIPVSGSQAGGGMSQGTVIGIAVGVVGGLLFLVASGLVFWFFRRSRREQTGRGQNSSQLLQSRTGTGTLSPGPASENGEPKVQAQVQTEAQPQPVMQHMHAVYEVDGRLFRIEMANDNGKFEMDACGHGSAELDTPRDGPSSNTEMKDAFPASPSVPDTPQSPPPQYAPRRSEE